MSYTLSTIAPKPEFTDAVDATVDDHVVVGEAADEARRHLDAAAAAAALLAEAIGVDEDKLAVSISGHANPGHGKVEGWSDEFITISVAVSR